MKLDKTVSYTLHLNEEDHMKLMLMFDLAKEAINYAAQFPERESLVNGTDIRVTASIWLREFYDLFKED